jgi:hypothetical protein
VPGGDEARIQMQNTPIAGGPAAAPPPALEEDPEDENAA